jgi:hypothetical protein
VNEDLWLELRPCHKDTKDPKELQYETVLRIPGLSEALKAVEKAGADVAKKGQSKEGTGGMIWDYSCKLDPSDAKAISSLFAGAQRKDDSRSTSLSIDYSYFGRCYTMTLFAFKPTG